MYTETRKSTDVTDLWVHSNDFRFGVWCDGRDVGQMQYTTICCCELFVTAMSAVRKMLDNSCCQLSSQLLGGKFVSQMWWNTNLSTVMFSHQCR